ncbi:hypothetical protein MMC12_006920 [Toensbergia leucococca]|nr:hypothetical protein [Toensbergia leucococca]
MDSSTALLLVGFSAVAYVAIRFTTALVKVRSHYRNAPGLAHSRLWGHMATMAKYVKDDKHFGPGVDYACFQIWKDLKKPPFYFIDAWPMQIPNVVIVADAELAESLSKSTPDHPYGFGKNASYDDLDAFLGESGILKVGGEKWKIIRKQYNPGFNSRYLQTLLPEIIHEVKIFTAKIDKSVGQTITLGDFITSLTIDIITAIVLGRSVNAQTEDGDLVTGFKGCIDWQIERERLNPFHLFNPLRPIAMSYYVNKLDKAVDREVENASRNKEGLNQRSIVSLAMKDEKSIMSRPELKIKPRDQIKTFLLVCYAPPRGHDTTSSLLQWLFYELSVQPKVLERLRKEHQSLFGVEPAGYHDRVEELFTHHPEKVLQGMSYTTAVIKETLRVHTVASGSRWSPKGNNLTAEYNGQTYNLDNHALYMPNLLHHMNPEYWGPDVEVFNPDRFLDTTEWNVPIFAFRPFERGPRACIGQELVYLETKVILALIINTFEFEKVYDTKYKELYSVRRRIGSLLL